MDAFRHLLAFLADITADQYLPEAKAIADIIVGMYHTASPLLAEIGRWLRPKAMGKAKISAAKRLANRLRGDRFDEAALRDRIVDRAASLLPPDGEGVVIAVDDTHLEKKWANLDSPHGQQYAARIYNADDPDGGSTTGYQVTHIVASLPGGLEVPLLLAPWSLNEAREKPISQWGALFEAVDAVRTQVGRGAIWAYDRGYDAHTVMAGNDERELKWVIRLKANRRRKVTLEDGTVADVAQLWKQLHGKHKVRVPSSRVSDLRTGMAVDLVHVRLATDYRSGASHRAEGLTRTLIVARRPRDTAEPWVLLAGRRVETHEIAQYLDAYARRWTVETGHRKAKNARGWGTALEQLQVVKYVAVRRLILLIQAANLFVSAVRIEQPELAARLVENSGVNKKETRDLSYRVFAGLKDVVKPQRPRHWRSIRARCRR